MAFLTELKRRNVFKVVAAYLALGWVVVQATATLAPALNLPASVLPLVTWIGVIGLPFVVVFSWAYELTPEGLKRESEVDRSQSITHVTSRRLDHAIIALLVVAIGLFVLQYLRPPVARTALEPPAPTASPTVASDARVSPAAIAEPVQPAPGAKSIAVLPFENVSSDAENEHFADGLHDELLTKLAKLHDLKVISRTSVMGYKGTTRNLREIGKALGVATILEGTVRKAGNRVRLSAQLIDAGTDAHLWAETYERELTDVFQIQTAVADEIAQALKVNFSAEERGAVDTQASANPEAYDLYLRARRYGDFFSVERDDLRKGRDLLERAVALDPRFAEAHGRLAVVASELYARGERTPERLAQAEQAITSALALDPELPSAHFAKANLEYQAHRRFEVALADLDRALAREPNYAEALTLRGLAYRRLGRWDEMLAAFARAVELNPRHPEVLQSAGFGARWMRRYAEAARYYDRAVAAAPDNLDVAAARATHEINWHGDLAMLREVVRRAEATGLGARRGWAWDLALREGRYDDADRLVMQWHPDRFIGPAGTTLPQSMWLAFGAWLRGDGATARRLAGEGRRELEPQLAGRGDPGQFGFVMSLMTNMEGDAAATDRWVDAQEGYARNIQDAVLADETRDLRLTLRVIRGEHDAALALLEERLAAPAGGAHAANVATAAHWRWSFGDDPRLKAIIARHLPKD